MNYTRLNNGNQHLDYELLPDKAGFILSSIAGLTNAVKYGELQIRGARIVVKNGEIEFIPSAIESDELIDKDKPVMNREVYEKVDRILRKAQSLAIQLDRENKSSTRLVQSVAGDEISFGSLRERGDIYRLLLTYNQTTERWEIHKSR